MNVYNAFDEIQVIGSAVANVTATKVQGSIQNSFYSAAYDNTDVLVGQLAKASATGVIIETTESIIDKKNVSDVINKLKGEE